MNEKVAELLEVDKRSVVIGEIVKGQTGRVVVRLSVRGSDFSTPNEFENLVEFLKYSVGLCLSEFLFNLRSFLLLL